MPNAAQQTRSRTNPLTVITPIFRGWSFVAWLFLVVMSKISKLIIARQLEFIHFARWQRIRWRDFPRLSQSQPQEKFSRDFFFFSTNFNGRWEQYIDTFALVPDVRHGIWWLWKFSKGFPGPTPIRHFKGYINYHTYPLTTYYNAYPQATVRNINAALIVSKALQKFREETSGIDDNELFEKKYRVFMEEISDHLASAPQSVPTT